LVRRAENLAIRLHSQLTTGPQSCITEDQKYQGKLYKEKKPKQQHQKKDSQQEDNSQALVPRPAYVEDAIDAETGAVAIVDAPPRAPSPPPAARSLGYNQPAAIEDVNVFDFLDSSETPNASRVNLNVVDESRMIEDSIPPAYEEVPQATVTDVMKFQVEDEEDHGFNEHGFAYGTEPIRPTSERFDSSYNLREQEPNYSYETPAPKQKHSRTKSRDKDLDTTGKKTDRKRKRNSPSELDMSLIRAQEERDTMMQDAPPMLHSGLTGGLNRLLARPEFPPSPELSGDYVENSPLSPMKRAKQGTSKALVRAQREWELLQEKDRKAVTREELAREKEERKERGRQRERKERKVSTALVKIKPKKRRDDSTKESRRHREERRRRHAYSSSPSPVRERKTVKAIEYHPSGSRSPGLEENGNGALIVRANGELAPVKTQVEARAELFMSFVTKGPESERGMSVNKALKRYHRERYDRWDRGELSKGDEEKELWKTMRLKRNDRGEIVLFFAEGEP
jgi:cell growth-regulating nucleolar protein